MPWDDDRRAEAQKLYLEQEPTAETSIEIVKEVAESMDESVNGVRNILTKAGVYISKVVKTSNKEGTSKRVGKAEQQQMLIDAINDSGQEADESIIEKLSGKASAYLAGVLRKVIDGDAD